MSHHLVVDEFVARGDLGGTVQHQHLAEEFMLEQNEMLMLGLHLGEYPLDRIGHAETEFGEQRLGNPTFLGHADLLRKTAGQAPAVAKHALEMIRGAETLY
jgi:hypothetical protein